MKIYKYDQTWVDTSGFPYHGPVALSSFQYEDISKTWVDTSAAQPWHGISLLMFYILDRLLISLIAKEEWNDTF